VISEVVEIAAEREVTFGREQTSFAAQLLIDARQPRAVVAQTAPVFGRGETLWICGRRGA
jgi:hypothetical protein